MEEEYKKKNPAANITATQRAIWRCQAAGNPLTWWSCAAPAGKLKDIALRILSAAPTSCSVERMNSMHKRVANSGRAALKHQRVVMMVYCYVNMRLLDNIDEDVLNMLDDAIADAIDEADAIAAGQRVAQPHAAAAAPAVAAAAADDDDDDDVVFVEA